MKKDYIVVNAEEAAADEDAYVENFWTKKWTDDAFAHAADVVPRSDLYRAIAPFLQQLPRGSHILDGGCGTGAWPVYLADLGFRVVGLDISERTIAHLKDVLPGHEWHRGDIRHTPFPAASFDAYLSWGTFEHFECGLGECIDEAYRILKPGGHLFVSVPFQNWRHILRDSGRLEQWDPTFDPLRGAARPQRFYQWRLTRPELKRELEIRGFRVELVRPGDKMEGVMRWLQWDARVVKPGSLAYAIARRVFAALLPAAFVSHMIVAVARKRPEESR